MLTAIYAYRRQLIFIVLGEGVAGPLLQEAIIFQQLANIVEDLIEFARWCVQYKIGYDAYFLRITDLCRFHCRIWSSDCVIYFLNFTDALNGVLESPTIYCAALDDGVDVGDGDVDIDDDCYVVCGWKVYPKSLGSEGAT